MTDILTRLRTVLAARYTIEREIGRGGMATVFLAQDLKHRRKVAIKALRPELSEALGAERFVREIQIAAALSHPHILPLHDSGEAEGVLYYVMPHVHGESLHGRLQRENQLDIDVAVRIAQEVASALSYAHERDVVHRDIKPGNILLADGHAVVADFGIARAISEAGGDGLTETGFVAGTPAYMSIEQAGSGQRVDGRSDIYSLGCVLYEMLAGEPPYTGRTHQAIILQKASGPVPSVRVLRETVPEAVERAVTKSLAKAPIDRFATAQQFAQALTPAAIDASSETTLIVPAVQPLRWRGRRVAGTVLAGLGFVLAAAYAFFILDPSETITRPTVTRLVVLPFENLGMADDDYFADGVTEEITSWLSQVEGLGVIARTSALQYKGETKSVSVIGRELDVEYVLGGTVRWQRIGDTLGQIRVTPQLTRVTDNTNLWTDRYDAVLADIFEVQSSIAQQVAGALGVALLRSGEETIAGQPTQSIEAYDHYLRGKAHDRRSASSWEDARQAIESYQRAVEIDPNFIQALGALVRAHAYRSFNWFDIPDENQLARQAVERLVAIAPDDPHTWIAQGFYYYYGLLDYETALRHFGRALERDPNNMTVVTAMGWVHRRNGQWDLAVQKLTRAFRFDPRDYSVANGLGRTHLRLRQFEEAERYFDHAIALAPDLTSTYRKKVNLALLRRGDLDHVERFIEETSEELAAGWLFGDDDGAQFRMSVLAATHEELFRPGVQRLRESRPLDRYWVYLAQALGAERNGRPQVATVYYDSIVDGLENYTDVGPQVPSRKLLAFGYAGLGRKEEAVEAALIAGEAYPRSRNAMATTPLEFLARIYAMVGEYDAAIEQLDELLNIPSLISIPLLQLDPVWDPMRDLPEFRRLLESRE